jgi:predicted MFS family arabinose efflux permease
MQKNKNIKNVKMLTAAILSLSLLTVMAGAAVAPALGAISAYFTGADPMLIQMIISMPALFIFATNLFFPVLSRHFRSRTLVLVGLVIYVAGGCAAGLFSNIYALLAARALVGIGVGIIMPLSTGLLPFYFSGGMQNKLMGWSSASSQIGGVIATFASGMLAQLSWRASFLVYLMGLLSIVLAIAFMPNDDISVSRQQIESHDAQAAADRLPLTVILPLVGAMFLQMFCFFIYPSDFAMETTKAGVISASGITLLMTLMDLCGFFSSFFFDGIVRSLGAKTRLFAPLLFMVGYLLLSAGDGLILVAAGSLAVGFAQGIGMPYVMAMAARRGGKNAASTIMPYMSASLYLAQFAAPVLLSAFGTVIAPLGLNHAPWACGMVCGLLLLAWNFIFVREMKKAPAAQAQKALEAQKA